MIKEKIDHALLVEALLAYSKNHSGYLLGMFSLDYETKLHVVSLRPRHKQVDFTSNDARHGVYVRASTQM